MGRCVSFAHAFPKGILVLRLRKPSLTQFDSILDILVQQRVSQDMHLSAPDILIRYADSVRPQVMLLVLDALCG